MSVLTTHNFEPHFGVGRGVQDKVRAQVVVKQQQLGGSSPSSKVCIMSVSDNSTVAPSRLTEGSYQLLDGYAYGVGDVAVNSYEKS